MQAKRRRKKVIIAKAEAGGMRFRKTNRRDQRIKVRRLFMESGLWRFIFDSNFINDFLKFFGAGVANFIILLVQTIDAVADLNELFVVFLKFRVEYFDLGDDPLDVLLETEIFIGLFDHP